jgi:hypothetical protein
MYVLCCSRIAHALIYEALAGRYHRTFALKPCERNWHLLLVAAAHAVCNDVNPVASSE